ncbi:O-antigen ligase family protein [Roseivirga seohaensis]|nr:O-antigen ligase domain-containing protein [Roseivirga seohaensis]
MSWLLYRKNVFTTPIRLQATDYLFIVLLAYALLYVFLPIGGVSFLNKLLYYKNILMLGLMYFLGRLMVLESYQVMSILKIIMTVTVLAFILNLFEKSIDTHFQTFIGYANLNQDINGIDPAGVHGLTYTFGAESGAKRFAAFFENPLGLASAMLMSFSAAFFLFLNSKSKTKRYQYGVLVLISVGSLLFAYSRSSLMGLFLIIFFIAIILGYYRLILYGFLMVVLFFASIFIFAGDDLRYFVIDTFSLADSSSLGHVVEWLEGIESIISNPLGIGLGTSGNAGGVNEELKVGGENQFIIFGVQLGVPFLILYVSLIFSSIYYSIKAYKLGNTISERAIPFVAATFKFAFLLPLMTANAETYLYVAYLSWWMVGYSIKKSK